MPLAVLPIVAAASPLDPGHAVWQRDAGRARSFAEALREERARRPPLYKETGIARQKAARFGRRVLVLPVLFEGEPAPVSREALRDRIFGDGEGTLRGYWDYVSGGRLRLEGVVLPWMRLSDARGLSFYRNVADGRFVSAAGPRLMAREALARAHEVHEDLLQFDDDGPDGVPASGDDDGVLDLVLVLHAEVGFEVDPSQSGPALLAVQDRIDSSIAPQPVEIGDGVFADSFMLASARGPLGVWVHEFGHLLGLEDLYDVDVGDAFTQVPSRGGLGVWSLMASGTWGGGGDRPSHLDPVSRRLLGWESREVVERNATVTLPTVDAASRVSAEIRPEGDWQRERFVVERRVARPSGIVDGGLPGDGVLVYRVDEALRENRSTTGFWIEALEADGRADLRNLVNNGDATDPFDGVGFTSLGPTTNPSTQSRIPSPSRSAPLISVMPPTADGSQRVDVVLAEGPRLRFDAAFFVGADDIVQTHLGFGQQENWQLRLRDVGGVAPSVVRLQVQSLDSRIEVLSGSDVMLSSTGDLWEPDQSVVLRETGTISTPGLATMRLVWELDADPSTQRSLDLPLPVRVFGGLEADALDRFVPGVLAASTDTTRFLPLTLAELPLPTRSGWGLRTAGTASYANSVEVALTGPFFAPPEDGRLGFWSRHQTEASLPGQVFDGGVCEVYLPDRGWRLLEPIGPRTVHVVQRSAASVRGAVGFGGAFSDWSAYEVQLPRVDVPLRLRFRFAADGSNTGEGWSVAGLRSQLLAPSAELQIEFDADGLPIARARLRGSTAGLATLRFRYRSSANAAWQPASQFFGVPSSSTELARELILPRDLQVATIALFAEVGGGGTGSTPPLLLGSTGFRARPTLAMPRILRNPSHRPVVLQLEPRAEDLRILVIDARGRKAGTIPIPANTSWYEWGGTSARGTRLASGVYFLVVEGREDLRRRILLLD